MGVGLKTPPGTTRNDFSTTSATRRLLPDSRPSTQERRQSVRRLSSNAFLGKQLDYLTAPVHDFGMRTSTICWNTSSDAFLRTTPASQNIQARWRPVSPPLPDVSITLASTRHGDFPRMIDGNGLLACTLRSRVFFFASHGEADKNHKHRFNAI